LKHGAAARNRGIETEKKDWETGGLGDQGTGHRETGKQRNGDPEMKDRDRETERLRDWDDWDDFV
jgi:hypothetical protein